LEAIASSLFFRKRVETLQEFLEDEWFRPLTRANHSQDITERAPVPEANEGLAGPHPLPRR
jgi:hypothetical protein